MSYIDLSHPLEADISTFPGSLEPSFEVLNTIRAAGYHERLIHMSSHMGTHIDAPCHILPGTPQLDEYPMDKFIGKATVLDLSKVRRITQAHLLPYAKKLEQVDFVLLYTGWQKFWKTPAYLKNFPVLQTDACEWLSGFRLKGIGMDTISPDPVESQLLPNHRILLAKEILIIENLTHLDQLADKTFDFYCPPLPVNTADGAPVRAFAKVNSKK